MLRPDLVHVGPVAFANSREVMVAASTTPNTYRSLWDVSIDGFDSRKITDQGMFGDIDGLAVAAGEPMLITFGGRVWELEGSQADGQWKSPLADPAVPERIVAVLPELSRPAQRERSDAQMISVELATALKQAGLVWHPASGDRFTLTTGAFDDEVFTLSDMVVEAQRVAAPARCSDSTGRPNGRWTPRRSPTRSGCRGRISCAACWARRSGRWSASTRVTG